MRAVLAHSFKRANDGKVLSGVMARFDRAAVNKDRRNVQTRHRYQCARHVLVTATDRQQTIDALRLAHGLDRIGDHFARDEAVLHAFSAHRDAVADSDCAEHLRHRPRLLQRSNRAIRKKIEAYVAGRDGAVAVRDGDDRLIEIGIAKADRAQHGAIRRALDSVSDGSAADIVVRH